MGRPWEGMLASLLEGMHDGRVAAVLGGPLREPLEEFLVRGLPGRIRERLGASGVEVPEAPDPEGEDPAPLWEWAVEEHAEAGRALAEALAICIGEFVQGHRDEVLRAMADRGEAPATDLEDRVRGAVAVLDQARGLLVRLEDPDLPRDEEALHGLVDPVVESLEEARSVLQEVEMDEAILGTTSPGGPARGRRREAWLLEAAIHRAVANRLGPPVQGRGVGTPEQQSALLDAIVAMQEALTIEADPATLLDLADLRLAKGDTGEARVLVGHVREAGVEEDLLKRAEALEKAIEEASPLAKDRRCFVATAALSEDAPELEVLRAWRDRRLLPRWWGRLLVRCYYRCSPPLARWLARSPGPRAFVGQRLVRPLARRLERSS
ncbi:MAG TPA: hypothetical protein PLQ97_00985 [Myxococcota bacterium]|nr:hypothetical protein [Myxococcota bacterium]HQK49749.1 hypothetical protein [Myxococcota bacterium]